MRSLDTIRAAFEDARDALAAFIAEEHCVAAVQRFAASALQTLEKGHKLMACGNGGSMCDAMHFCEEWSGRFRKDRPALRAVSLSDPAALTCIANDFGYEQVFARQVEGIGFKGDLLVLLSTSGNSPNLLRAAERAKAMGIGTVALLGRGGGALAPLVDLPIVVPKATTSDRIQEVHIKILHIVIETVERKLFPSIY